MLFTISILDSKDLVDCPICWETVPIQQTFALWCDHRYCLNCWQNYIVAQVKENVISIDCPDTKCHAVLTHPLVKQLLLQQQQGSNNSPDNNNNNNNNSPSLSSSWLVNHQSIYKQYTDAVLRSFVNDNPQMTWCKNPKGCDAILATSNLSDDVVSCGLCGHSFCSKCSFPAHKPATCAMMKEWEKKGGYVELSDDEKNTHRLKLLTTKVLLLLLLSMLLTYY